MNTSYMKKKLTRHLCAMLATASMLPLCVSCDKDAHADEYPLPEGQGAVIIGLESETAPNGLAVYLFGEDGSNALRKAYDDPRGPASEYIPVDAGSYTVIVAANADNAALPQETTLPDLAEWLKEHHDAYPALLTASAMTEVKAGEVNRLHLELKDGTDGIRLSAVRLSLTVPGLELPAYVPTKAFAKSTAAPLRCVAEVYLTGTESRIHRRTLLCTPQEDGTYLAELSLMPGAYDLRLWADRDGGYYNTDDLSAVTVLTDSYVANGETDKKDAFYTTSALNVGEEDTEQAVALTRPFARYRLIATDAEAYHNLIDKGEALPPIEDLQVRVTYEGFFPTGFDVATGKPNDALNTGIHYTSVPTLAEGYDEAANRQVGADFVLTNGEESFVTVTIQMFDTLTGETIATVQHVNIPYRRGHLSTVTGHFLTAGKTPGGVQIDTEWDDTVIEF